MTIEQRLEQLERQSRWMKRVGAVLVAVVATVLLVGQGKTDLKELEVKALIVKDENGKSRISLRTMANGTAGMYIFSKDVERRVAIEARRDGNSSVTVYGSHGKAQLDLGTHSHGMAALNLFDRERRLRASFLTHRKGQPSLYLYDENAKGRATLGATTITDTKTGKVTGTTSESALTLFNAKGDVIWQAPR